jgi:hypothetical protein
MILTPLPTAHQDSQVFEWHESMGGLAADPFSDPENDQPLLNGQLLDADLERFDVDSQLPTSLPEESVSFSIEGEPHYCEILFMI